MKCFWAPYICLFAGLGVAHFDIWNLVISALGGKGNRLLVNFVRHIILVFAIFALYLNNKDSIREEMNRLS